MRALLLAGAALTLSGCVYISDNDFPGEGTSLAPELGGPERLIGAVVEPGGVRVVAASNGCTTEDSFDVDVQRVSMNGGSRFVVRLEREAPDRCRAFMADGVELFFSRERLGLSPDAVIVVGNSVGR